VIPKIGRYFQQALWNGCQRWKASVQRMKRKLNKGRQVVEISDLGAAHAGLRGEFAATQQNGLDFHCALHILAIIAGSPRFGCDTDSMQGVPQ
jgi:hypothetical protein